MVQVGQQSQHLLTDFVKRQSAKGQRRALDPLNLIGRVHGAAEEHGGASGRVMEAQFQLWRDYMGLWERTARA